MNYLPSRKLAIVILTVLVVGGGWFFVSQENKFWEKDVLRFSDKNDIDLALSREKQKDSDNDGLLDWEESLWKTDLNNPDSDGDGVSDGDEVKGGRNPTVAGPNDSLENTEIFSDSGKVEKPELTKTDIFARQFFSLFFALQQSGNLNERTKQEFTESFLKKMSEEKIADTYGHLDLNIIKSGSDESFKKYGNETAKIINKYQPAGGEEDEISIIRQALENENEGEFRKIKPIIKIYQNVAQDLLAIGVPEKIAGHHLELLNSSFNLSKILGDIARMFEDPIIGIIGINQYPREYFRFRDAFGGISQYFSENAIFFSEREDGYIFTNK